MRDFTIKTYKAMLQTMGSNNYLLSTFKDFLGSSAGKSIVLRHDVDRLPENSLVFAKIQEQLYIKGTYYFRIVPKSFNMAIIKEIASLGHEIGYHYETMDSSKGNINKAYDEFCRNLEIFRKIVPVSTICMHGSPLSKYDNRDIWKKYDYRKLGIIGEPYFDIDFNEVLYLTDTGRRWDGEKFAIRDKLSGSNYQLAISNQQSAIGNSQSTINNQQSIINNQLKFHSTNDIIKAAQNDLLPPKIMFTFHPQRWTDKPLPWLKELVWQGLKNQVKVVIARKR